MENEEIKPIWAWAWEKVITLHLSYTETAFFLLLIKESYCSGKEREVIIGQNKVTEIFGGSGLTVRKCREALRKHGIITYEVRKGFPCKYIICAPGSITVELPAEQNIDDTIEKVNTEVKEEENTAPKKANKPLAEEELHKKTAKNVITPAPTKPNIKTERFKNIATPSLDEFVAFGRTLEGYSKGMDIQIEGKYRDWSANDWLNGFDKPIRDWKAALMKSWPYMKQGLLSTTLPVSAVAPRIKRPKQTYNE